MEGEVMSEREQGAEKVRISNAELQRLILEYEYLQRLAEALRSRIETLNMLKANLTNARNVLNEMENKEKGHEILVPIGGGFYIHTELRDPSKVLIDLGARYVVERNREGALDYLNSRLEEIENSIREATGQLSEVTNKIAELEPLLRKYLAERRT